MLSNLALVAQLAEQLPLKQTVGGSMPSGRTNAEARNRAARPVNGRVYGAAPSLGSNVPV
jgi:hypothetical protein